MVPSECLTSTTKDDDSGVCRSLRKGRVEGSSELVGRRHQEVYFR